MRSGILARFFRWSNSKLIESRNILVEKTLKVFFHLSVVTYRSMAPSAGMRPDPVVIDNFDSDIWLNVDRSRSMGAAIYWTGFHEFREFLFLHRYLKPEMIFVDVGANLGEYTLFAAKRLPRGKVLAFEPLSSIRSVLEENIRLNGFTNIEVYPVGLSSHAEMMTIHEFDDVHEGLATFYPGERSGRASVAVELKTLDEVVSSSRLQRVDFIKIDIEGGELKALQGCRQVIGRFRPVFMIEVNDETYRAAGYTADDVLEFFATVHYTPYQIKKRGAVAKCEVLPSFGNILFMPR